MENEADKNEDIMNKELQEMLGDKKNYIGKSICISLLNFSKTKKYLLRSLYTGKFTNSSDKLIIFYFEIQKKLVSKMEIVLL